MTLHASIALFAGTLSRFDETLRELELTLDDGPEVADEPVVLEAMRASIVELHGELHELVQVVDAQSSDDGDAAATRRTGRALAAAQEQTNAMARRLRLSLATHANLVELSAIARARGGAAVRWREAVQQALETSDDALERVSAALVDCWRELADRGGVVAVSATTTAHTFAVEAHEPSKRERSRPLT